jgi:hypothetical protein
MTFSHPNDIDACSATHFAQLSHSLRLIRRNVRFGLLALAILAIFVSAPVHAQSIWSLGSNGNWNTAGNWAPVGVPNGSTTDVTINDGVSTVAMNLSPAVNDLIVGAGNTLVFNNQRVLSVHGRITNNGTIFANQTGNSGSSGFTAAADITLGGSGVLRMVRFANSGNSRISSNPGFTLTQLSGHSIVGAGRFDAALINQGVVRADVSMASVGNTMVLSVNNKTNQGLFEAAANSVLNIDGITVDNTGGTIRALADGNVAFSGGVTISGGTVESVGTGIITTSNPANTNFENVTILGRIETASRGDIGMTGTINNAGTIQLNSGNATSDTLLEILGAGATLTGGGTIRLIGTSGANEASLTGAGGTLTIVDQTFEGSGDFGRGAVEIINEADGLIHANTAGRALIIDANASGLTNRGTLRASNGGTLRIDEVFSNDGIIHAESGSLVDSNGSLINNETGEIRGAGELEVNTVLTNDGLIAPGDSTGTLLVDMGGTGLVQLGNTSVLEIELASIGDFDRLTISGNANLNGDLVLDLLNGFIPDFSDVFTIMTSGNDDVLTLGEFANVANEGMLLTVGGEGHFQVRYQSDGLNSQVQLYNFTASAIPEPSAVTICMLGLSGFALLRRRRSLKAGNAN